jgi:predicted MFS family arabinose efflux permease
MLNEQRQSATATWTLLALALSAFAIGSTEFISVGVMPLIIKTFGISLSTAGLTVSIYAAGVTVGAPVLTSLTGRFERKTLLLAVMVTFIIGNLITAMAPSFTLLLIGRVIAALAHGLFMSVATVIAASVVPANRRASAIATMFTGLTVATVTGVPLGTFIGQHASWRMSFTVISAIGFLALIASQILVPAKLPKPVMGQRGGFWRILKQKELLLGLIVTAIGYGASFPVYTYLTTILADDGWSTTAVVLLLIVYGVMVAIGNVSGGRFANVKPLRALAWMFTALAVVMASLLVGMGAKYFGLLFILAMGLLAFMNVPGLQLYTMQIAETKLPADVQLASSLNISAFNVGVMLGSFTGGQIVSQFGLAMTPVGGLVLSLLALGLIGVAIRMAKTTA